MAMATWHSNSEPKMMKQILLTFWLFSLCTPVLATSQEKLALVIGNADYQGAKLGTPVHDADDIAQALIDVGFTVDKFTNVTQQGMEVAIENFTNKLTENSIAVFYYSGHAVEVQGQNYLLPVGKKITKEANVRYDAVNVGRLLDGLKSTNQGLNLVILDACRDNPLEKSSKSGRYGLAQVAAPSGSLIAYATAPGKVALTGGGRNSVYTKALLKHLKTVDLEVSDMLKKIAVDVKTATGGHQTPWTGVGYTGNFAFVGDADDKDKLYIAVLDFNVEGVKKSRGKFAKSLLIQALNRTGKFRTFDRSVTLEYIADEFQLEGSELMDDTVAKRLKRLYSVEGFVSGDLFSGAGEITVSLKLVKTTGEITTANTFFEANLLNAKQLVAHLPGLAEQLAGNQTIREGLTALGPKPGKTWTDATTGMAFVWVPKGCFEMGSGSGDKKPVHEVCLDGFWIGKYEVTVNQYMKFVNDTGRHHPEWLEPGSDYNINTGSTDHYSKQGASLSNGQNPIMGVSWNNTQDFAKWASRKSGKNLRLPREAEWEYACRSGGKDEKFSGSNSVRSVAWYANNSGGKTHQVGTKLANGLGIYDMSGNVWEWVQDIYDKDAYRKPGRNNPIYEAGGQSRVIRGGSWYSSAGYTRCAIRHKNSPGGRGYNLGLRLLRTP